MFPNNYSYNPYAYGIIPYQVAQNPNLRQGEQETYYEMNNNWSAVPVTGSTLNNFNNTVIPGGYPDSRGLGWNGFTNMNGFPPPSGLSFPSNGVGFAPSYVGVGSYSGPPNSAVPIPDAMPSNDALPQSDTYPWMPPRGVPAQLVSPSEKQILPHEKSNPPINPISPASSDSLDERSVESSSWGDHAQEFATLFEDDDPEDDNPQDLMATSAEPGAPDLAVSSKNTDIPFDVTDKLSMEATKLSTIAGGLSSTMSRLSEVMNELPATADKLANTVSDLSQTVPLISSKVEGISSFHEGLNARTQQLSDTVDKLSQTLSEMVKRERIVMEAFGTMKEIRERPQVPFEFQNKATRKRK